MSKSIFPSIQLFSIHMRLSINEVMVVRVYERGPMAHGLIPYSADVTIKYNTSNGTLLHEEFIFLQLHGDMPGGYEGDIEGQKRWVLEHIIGENEQESPHKHPQSLAQQNFLNDYTQIIMNRIMQM